MNTKVKVVLISMIVILGIAACQTASGASQGNSGSGNTAQMPSRSGMQTQIASNPALATRIASGGGAGGPGGLANASDPATPTSTTTPAPTSTPEPTATSPSPTAGAVQAAQEYFAALQSGDFSAASKLVSSFSLLADRLTASDVVDALTQQKSAGAAWSNFQVVGSQVFTDNTVLVHVTYQLSSVDAKTGKTVQSSVDEQWPFRYENSRWLYNWTNIIDFETLDSSAKLSNGLTITPLQLTRYSDKIRLTVLAQNSTAQAIVIGGTTNQLLGAFHFGSQTVEAVNTRYILDSYRSYTNINIDAPGLFTSFPDAVELVKYKSTTAAPWFTFALAD